jgi:ABC-type transport system involved in cytochrome c biogenesis permease component
MDNVTLIRVVSGLMFFVVLIPLYFLPTFLGRNKRQRVPIFVLNLLLGWTLLGWVGALVWALTG